MTLRIGKSGEIVLPKRVREKLGLRKGSDVCVEETAEGFVIGAARAERKRGLVRKKGLLVYDGELPPGVDVRRIIDEVRAERDMKLAGS